MMYNKNSLLLFVGLAALAASASALRQAPDGERQAVVGPVLVTGATGRTGSLLYESLKSHGLEVKALVRNATKARERLSCGACGTEDGIFVGDVTDPSSMTASFHGVKQLVILTASYPLKLPNGSYYFPEGGYPKDIDWQGSNNQVRCAHDAGVDHVLLVSSMGTTEPDSFLDLLGNGHDLFYKLNGEADLMASGMPFTIVKPGGLLDDAGGQHLLLAGHNDDLERPRVTRADVADVLLHAIMMPSESKWLRFDLSSDATKCATGDFKALFQDARNWQGAGKHVSLTGPDSRQAHETA
mmetsp:Transcript_15635/g.43735  ORF Transcript_15635/g.43735 Transcript_15635/m.43735 type:complete len:298 (+) Transcript_15635:91-984(+)|eukprot:CAMPEP_0117675926 /NCGR_PEP_ID=MMETSP0804-20121206/15876_1 /TAXON_ID=1074897 /ORGANISM="Tetraselmis astigmatica, Strain CCMP880" /LENGTH=297 /DNA_ID=CAMNT_0005484983 /DNA_START=61 /DNA_END=954 /DNA_ORIENTATION=+